MGLDEPARILQAPGKAVRFRALFAEFCGTKAQRQCGGTASVCRALGKADDWEEPNVTGKIMWQGQSLQSTLRRGWYFGSQAFREKMLAILKSSEESQHGKKPDRNASIFKKESDLARAAKTIKQGLGILEIDSDPHLDEKKCLAKSAFS